MPTALADLVAFAKKTSPLYNGLASTLEGSDVRGLKAFRPLGDFEFDCLAFVQRLVPLRLNGGEMDENVFARLPLDESKTLAGIEPLHCSLFFQLCFSFLFELFGCAFHCLQPKKKTARVATRSLQQF